MGATALRSPKNRVCARRLHHRLLAQRLHLPNLAGLINRDDLDLLMISRIYYYTSTLVSSVCNFTIICLRE